MTMMLPHVMAIQLLLPRATVSRALITCSLCSSAFFIPAHFSTSKCYPSETATWFATSSSSDYGGGGQSELRKLTVKQLKERLREEGLSTSGLKAELVGRLSASISPPSKYVASSMPEPPQSEINEKIDAIEQINPNWRKTFSSTAALQSEIDDTMAKNVGSNDTISCSVKQPINIMLFASEVPVITGLNPYRDISDVFKTVWERCDPEHVALLQTELATDLDAVEEEPERLARLISNSDGAGSVTTRAIDEAASVTSSSAVNAIISTLSEEVSSKVVAEPKAKQEIFDHVVNTIKKDYGTRLENSAIKHYEEKSATVVKENNDNFWHRKLGTTGNVEVSLGGRIDGKNNEGRVIEVKNRLKRFMKPLPKYDICQLQSYMFILDAREGELVEHLRRKELRTRSTLLPRDRVYWEKEIMPCLVPFAHSIAKFIRNKQLQKDFLLHPDPDYRKGIVRDLMFNSPKTLETRLSSNNIIS